MNKPITNVLVIEDDLCLSVIMEQILKSATETANLIWTTSAEEAEVKLEENKKIDLIIADYTLEGKATGLDLWKTCTEKYPAIPFVLISALGVDTFIKLVGNTEICPPFLPKPFYTGECRQLIESLIGNKKTL